MMLLSPQATVRAQARDALKHNYARAIIAFLTALLPVFITDGAVTGVVCIVGEFGLDGFTEAVIIQSIVYPLMIAAGIFASPFINGYVRVYYRNAFTGEMDLNDLFYYFEDGRYKRTLKLNLSFMLRLLLPAVISYLPLVLFVIISANIKGFTGSVPYRDFYLILAILSSVIITLYALRYFAVLTLYVENESLSNKELFDASKHIMRSQSVSAAKLIFSYTPWMLLCFTVLPVLYVAPYMTQGVCIGAKWMIRAAYEG